MRMLLPCLIAIACVHQADAREEVVEEIEVGKAISGFRVGFSLLTTPQRQYAAYYDDQNRMTVVSRRLDEAKWQRKVLPSKIGWDSHNYVTKIKDFSLDANDLCKFVRNVRI